MPGTWNLDFILNISDWFANHGDIQPLANRTFDRCFTQTIPVLSKPHTIPMTKHFTKTRPTVTFYTHNGHMPESIYRFTDTYQRFEEGQETHMTSRTRVVQIAEGQGGFIH